MMREKAKKQGRKSKAKREQIIDGFRDMIDCLSLKGSNFADIKYIDRELERFDKWGYSLGEPTMFKIRNLKIRAKEENEEIDKLEERLRELQK